MSDAGGDGQRRGLYPEIAPYDQGWLRVSDLHEIHYEQCGNPERPAALFVHGGPGGGFDAEDRRFFDPDAWRVVLFDQRGAGRSRPHACLEENTTQHLIADMEALRSHLGIERWMLFGGSWGSTLSLAYAQAHPERVTAMVLRGIFLLRRWELDWYYGHGTQGVFPEAADRLHGLVPEGERGDIVGAYHRMVTGKDEGLRRRALEAWSRWEAETSSLYTDPKRVERFSGAEFAEAFAGIELHYFANGGFFPRDGELLLQAGRIASIPGVIVHGRYDMVCPVRNAVDLHAAWPGSELHIVADAGHASREPGTIDCLVRATDRFAGKG
ncbi:prolyl aminopeptidase [Marinibaculum pumilum]|uniref:Proline iminopeptidase n=1 Tax=Marinibaculum pumilum TaxID=1766165 RepID=A0ABV7L8K1_9PROT